MITNSSYNSILILLLDDNYKNDTFLRDIRNNTTILV